MTWNIKAIRQSSTQALLSWDVPRDVLISFHYRVDCKKCEGGRCNQNCNGVTVGKPLNDRQESRSVTGLEGGRKYVFTVSARKVDSNDSSDGKMWNSSVTLRGR